MKLVLPDILCSHGAWPSLCIGLLALAQVLAAAPAAAEGVAFQIADPVYRSECGSCHIAYPPRLLGADGWHEIFADLHHHFGVYLDLPPGVVQHLAGYTASQAGPLRLDPGTRPRLTLTRWFVTTHRAVQDITTADHGPSRAPNCPACHRRADNGDYTGGSLRVPHRQHDRSDFRPVGTPLRPGQAVPTLH